MIRKMAGGTLIVMALMTIMLLSVSCSPPTTSASSGGGKLNIVVLCSTCSIPQAENTANMILLDQDSGEVWAYKDGDLSQQPLSLGRLSKVGVPVQKQ